MTPEEHVPVLIVGAGPVGLSLAGDLGWRGIRCQLIERGDGSIYQPRMDMVGIRTMEFCRRWGIADEVVNSPYPQDYPQDNVWLESFTGWEFGREPMVSKAEEPIPPQSPQKRERCPQDMFDPILKRFVERFAQVRTDYETELVSFEQDDERVVARLRATRTGELRSVSCDYLVGTDGAASAVREGLGIAMHGKPVLTYTTNVIFRCKDLPALHDKGKAYRFIFIDRDGTWLTIVAIDGADRWRMSVVGNEEKRKLSDDEIHGLILRAMGKPFDYEIESVMPWVRRQLLADTYQEGPRLPRRRFLPSHLAYRRVRHEHRYRRQRRSCLEARRDVLKGWGGQYPPRQLYDRAAAGSRPRPRRRPAAISAACLSTRTQGSAGSGVSSRT